MEPDNVKDALKTLIDYNGVNSNPKVKDSHGKWVDASAEDVKEFNTDLLYFIADSLGMSELYLNDEISAE